MTDDPTKHTPPIIDTEWGPVTEKYRHVAAMNMRNYPQVKARVIALIGEVKARERYPEGFEDQDETQA